ncbi:MAG: TlyA family RNA methyltransferase, partial [Acidimicrobiia bacterium]|nr:TlyA family RNA methyltransferase [Acidimicrobiia bacterium]
PRYVGRAGEKLEAALDHFPIKVEGRRALDAGASTGGFTHCLLARGAVSVLAVDVGSGQIDSELARHPAVIVRERTDIRHLVADEVGGPFPLVVVDLSFISICAVTETLSSLLAEDGDLLILVKPQFEAGRGDIGRGVVRDTESQHMAVTKAKHCLTAVGLDSVGTFASPMTGEHGNQEYFLWARKRG